MPMISVIVPVYKVEKYIHRCVDSILGQTFRDFELILVDDGSPDNCGAICDEYAVKDRRIQVIHRENGGLSAARNAGIDWAFTNSNSEWLTFIDSDDWVHPEYLERLLNAALENHVAVSVCGYVTTGGEEPDITASEMTPQIWAPEDFYVEHNVNAIVAWGKLYCKDCFETVRYPVGRIHEDEYVTHEFLFREKKITVIAAPMYFYFENTTGITQSQWNVKRLFGVIGCERQMIYMKCHGYKKGYRHAVRKYVSAIYGYMKKLEQSDLEERRKYIAALRRKLRHTLLLNRKLMTFEENIWFYEYAFPKTMWCYWAVKAQVKKFKK